jgi:hypothetical protein
MQRCAISSIFGCCAGYHVIMANGPAITEENHVRSIAKLTTLRKAVSGDLTGIIMGKPHPYHPPVPPTAAFPKSNTIKVVKKPTLKRDSFVTK